MLVIVLRELWSATIAKLRECFFAIARNAIQKTEL